MRLPSMTEPAAAPGRLIHAQHASEIECKELFGFVTFRRADPRGEQHDEGLTR
jgi:hypothetical protein